MKKTMRLLPAAPLLVPRETLHKCSIDGYEIPTKNPNVCECMGRRKRSGGLGKPRRVLAGEILLFSGRFQGTAPSGAGRRVCPGKNMGAVTVELTLANLLYSFDWEMPLGMNKEDLDFDVIPGIIMQKKNALSLMAKNYI